MNRKTLFSTIVGAAALLAAPAWAQSTGTVSKAVGGYSFDEAAKGSPDTKNHRSNDGKLTFAIVTHTAPPTAANGFFAPTYVGPKVAADPFGVNLLMLGPEAPT